MRTTIDLPDKLFRRAKAVASLRGITLKKFFSQAIEHELITSEFVSNEQRVKLPLVPSKLPGSNRLTPERTAELLEEEDVHVLTGH